MSSAGIRQVVADSPVRERALASDVSWMLQAPAGSGKTELLMQRFLACLSEVDEPEAVLAITFTRKAANEMRNRILSSLQQASELEEAALAALPEHKRRSLSLARRALENSDRLGWRLLEQPSRLAVRTLDAFCESLSQRAPFRGQMGGAASVSEDAWPLYQLAAQRVVEALAQSDARGEAVAALLRHLDNDVSGARELLAQMLARRDQWLHFLGRTDALDGEQQRALRTRLEDALRCAIEEELTVVASVVSRVVMPARREQLVTLLRYATAQMEGAAEPIERIPAMAANAAEPSPLRDLAFWPSARVEALPIWRALAHALLLSDKSALRRKVDKRNGFPVNTPEERERKERFTEILAELAMTPGSDELCAALGRLCRLPDPVYTSRQWDFMRAVLELLPLAAAHLKLVFAEQGTVDFGEYAQRALEAIGGEGDPTELGFQLGYRIRHVLVDEFQDTNRVQVELLSRLLRTWEEGERCSVFFVGDPMQSIYAFRQADVAIYQQARREGIGELLPSFERLTQNFRSQAGLVEWFNQVFPRILREDNDLTNAVAYSPAVASRPALEGEAVMLRGFGKGERVAEAQHLARRVREELAAPVAEGSAPSTIAILVRSRSHLPELVEALRAEGVRYRAVKTDRLAERPLVRDLEALRMALADAADRTAWLSVLRAPWCGLSLADLLTLCRGEQVKTIRELVGERQRELSDFGQSALARVWPVLDEASSMRGRRPLRELVESTWLRLGGLACVEEREQGMRDAAAYFALLDAESVAGELAEPRRFAQKLHELFSPADTASGIRVEIMPIHQAKGLEWDVVFLPALERQPQRESRSLLYWRLRRRAGEEFLLLGPMEARGEARQSGATLESYLRDLSTGCSREELKRLFYVAATRARHRLYLSAVVPDGDAHPNRDSMLALLWELPELRAGFAPQSNTQEGEAASAAESETVARTPLLLRRLAEDYRAPEPPAALAWCSERVAPEAEAHRFEWVGELLPKVGVVAHSFLECIAREGVEHWDDRRVAAARETIERVLLRAGVARAEVAMGTARVVEALTRTLADPRGRWLLSNHSEARSEFALSAVVEGELKHIRVDRTFVEDGTRWLVDYKVTGQEGGDRERFLRMQVEKYRKDMQRYVRVLAVYDSRPVRCALYLPLLGEFCEVAL